MRPPRFWYQPPDRPHWVARALVPLAALWARAAGARRRRPGYRAGVPMICVGNLNLGGTGKTPTVIALADRLQAAGVAVHVVSRGYRGSASGPLRVDPRHHDAARVGDEPLLIAAFAPVWIARDRAAGVRAAEAAGAEAILLDDGLQNPGVAPHAAIVVVDAALGFGNGRVLPAGPLREPVAAGLARADAVLVVGAPAVRAEFRAVWGEKIGIPMIAAEVRPLATGMDWQDLPVLAFAGIGFPQKFFATVRGLGARIVRAEALSDHQPLIAPLMRRLQADATAAGAQLVTTEKDAVRLPESFRQQVLTVPVRLQVDDWAAVETILAIAGISPDRLRP